MINPVQDQPSLKPQTQSPTQTYSQTRAHRQQSQQWLLLQCQFWLSHTFILSMGIFLIAQCISIHQNTQSILQTDQYHYTQQAIQLWSKGYIVDIRQVQTDNCPQNYQPLINYYWPGSRQGCFCQTVLNNHNTEYILEGACSSELISYQCRTVEGYAKENMKMWKGGKLLCYKRVKGINFYNSTNNTNNNNNSNNSKICGYGKQYRVQTLPDLQCPITTVSNTTLGYTTQTILQLDQSNNNYLYYMSQIGYPIADFKLTQYSFCPFWDMNNISPNKTGNYILQYTNMSSTCVGADPRIVQFDYLTEQQYYTNNTRVYEHLQELPGYPRPSISYFYRLGYVRYPDWTDECRRSQTHSLESATQHLKITSILYVSSLLLYVCVPFLVVCCILIRILYIIRHVIQLKSRCQYHILMLSDEDVNEQIPTFNFVKNIKKEGVFLFIQLGLFVSVCVLLCIATYTFIQQSIWIKQAFIKKCTNQHIQWILRQNQDKVDTCQYIAARAIMLVVVVVIVVIGHFVIRRLFGDLKRRNKNGQEVANQQEMSKNNNINNIMDEAINLQDSSDIILQREREQGKMYDIEHLNVVGNSEIKAGETGLNFYEMQSIQQPHFQIVKKKKKKGIRRKNLFKDEKDDEKE